jgi:hypothetical protein
MIARCDGGARLLAAFFIITISTGVVCVLLHITWRLCMCREGVIARGAFFAATRLCMANRSCIAFYGRTNKVSLRFKQFMLQASLDFN